MYCLRYCVHLAYICLILGIIVLAHRWGYQQGFGDGVLSVYNSFAETPSDGTCYARKGCSGK